MDAENFEASDEKHRKIGLVRFADDFVQNFDFYVSGNYCVYCFFDSRDYFNFLLKQETFCKQMIEVNKLTETNADLEKKCGSLNINELLENNRMKK